MEAAFGAEQWLILMQILWSYLSQHLRGPVATQKIRNNYSK